MNKFNIDDFNKKIDDSASKLDELIDRASKANNVGGMLDQTNNRLNEALNGLNETLKILKDIYVDLSVLINKFEESKKQLSDGAGLFNSTSEDLIKIMDTLSSDITNKMAQFEKKLYFSIIVFLLVIVGAIYFLN